MKVQSQIEYKQEANGVVRQHPHEQPEQQQQQQQQERRIRVLEPARQQRASSSPESTAEPATMLQPANGWRHHAELEGARELVLEADEFGLTWGVTHEAPGDDGEFKLRLLQRPSPEPEQQQQQQQPRPFKCVEVSRESLDLLCYHEPKIRSLMLAHDKAIIFQNMDVQVYVMEELKEEGFRVHFQDKRRVKVSLTYQQFLSFVSALPRVDNDYLKYKKKLKIKKNKLSRSKGINAIA